MSRRAAAGQRPDTVALVTQIANRVRPVPVLGSGDTAEALEWAESNENGFVRLHERLAEEHEVPSPGGELSSLTAAERSKAALAALVVVISVQLRAIGRAPRWRRRESNPRPRSHRQSVYKLRLPLRFARRPVCSRPTAGLVILRCRASGDDVPSAPSPLVDAADRATGPVRSDALCYGLGSESECAIVIRTCVFFPVVLRGRPGTSACNSAGEPTTSKPGRPRMSSRIVAAALRGKNLVQDARPSHDHRRRLPRGW